MAAPTPRRLPAAPLLALLAGGAVWLLAAALVSGGVSDPCPSRVPEGFDAGGYRVRLTLWPPRYDCVFTERGGGAVVAEPIVSTPAAILLGLLGVAVLAAAHRAWRRAR